MGYASFGFAVNDVENSQFSTSYVHYDLNPTYKATFDAGAPSAASTPIQLKIGSHVLATGTFGYQRNYAPTWPSPTEVAGYQYIVFDTWNTTGQSGDVVTTMIYNASEVYHIVLGAYGNQKYTAGASGTGYFVQAPTGFNTKAGYHTWNKNYVFLGAYSVEQRSDSMLYGNISKNVGGTTYNAQALVFNSDTSNLISSEPTTSGTTYNFVALPTNLTLSSRDATGKLWNSSPLIFQSTYPTPTPTPTPTGTPVGPSNPIPAGYVRSMAECVDGTTNGRMGGCDVSLKDVEAGTWANSSTVGWDYGYYWIDTLPNHTIDAYGVLSGYSPVSRTGEPASGTRMIELVMWDISLPGPSTAGMVVLNVLANDIESGYALPGATVQVKDGATGITYTETTPTSGTARFEVTNKSTSYITVKKYGYVSKTVTLETSDFGPDTKRVELERATVTTGPTPTIPVGGVTTAVTVDPVGTPDPAGGPSGYSNAKGQQMMDYLAAHGMDLVQLCFLVTILGLMGIKLGK